MKKEQISDHIEKMHLQRAEKLTQLEEELTAYQAAGCVLKLDGKRAYPRHVAESCFRERGSYMRDFVYDDAQQLREIHFIRLREERSEHQVRHKKKKMDLH